MTCTAPDCTEVDHLAVYRDGNPVGVFCSWRCLCRYSMEAWERVEGL